MCAAEARIEVRGEREVPRLGLVAEVALDGLAQLRERQLLALHRDGARLDLRQVEDVADEIQQVGAGGVDGLGELHLARREIALRILGELLAQDQDAVERRAQLVRHVGQELGLVARGERELGRLFFERLARLLDFLVLALHFGVLLGEQPRLGGHFLVGLLQLDLLRLQFAGELLGLLEQALGAHRRFDGVEHHADGAGELLEEGQVRRGEFVQRGQLDDRLDLAFVQHRQHDDIARLGFHQAAAEAHGVGRNARQQQALALHGALADEAFAEAIAARLGRLAHVGVTRELLEVTLRRRRSRRCR